MDDESVVTATTTTTPPNTGAFMESLVRTNKEIRKGRAEGIKEDLELMYSRDIQDMRKDLRVIKRDLEDMLDMSPTNAQSLVLASDFKAGEFTKKRVQLMTDRRNLSIKLELAEEDYEYLFGQKCS